MGLGAARLGDQGSGTCAGHEPPLAYTTRFTEGSDNVFIDGLAAVVVGDIGTATCGDDTVAKTGSPTVFVNGAPLHRINDVGANKGPYTVTTGSLDVLVG
jgi:uncharacterized Zn-binding protein involved in type VI secretion